MKKSLRIVFFGNERIATGIDADPRIFEWLTESGHQLLALVVHTSDMTSRRSSPEPIIELAKKNNIPVFNPRNFSEIMDELTKLSPDCGVLVAYGKIVPKEVIDLFPQGILNLHPSLLPKLRGSTPVETAILERLPVTGVSIMSLVQEMDAGPIHKQLSVPISAHITKQELAILLHETGKDLMEEALDELSKHTLSSTPQKEEEATFTKRLKKEDGRLEWSKPALVLEAEVRAYAGWPNSYFIQKNTRFVVLDAVAHNQKLTDDTGTFVVDETSIKVQTAEGNLDILALQPEGKKPMSAKDFLNGYRAIF